MRKPIFDIIRAQRGKGFNNNEVREIDELLDRLEVERDEEESGAAAPNPAGGPATGAAPSSAGGPLGLENPAEFFDAVRDSGVLGKSLKPDQVKGMEAILRAAKAADWSLAFTAYALATACHETACTMQPVREAFWLSENWRSRNLRYYPFYGRGYVQLTWKANYDKADRELGLGGRLINNSDLAMDPDIAANIMIKGMHDGWFCADKSGRRHKLDRHLPQRGDADKAQFISARRIINGTDKAGKIADEALAFQKALRAGGW